MTLSIEQIASRSGYSAAVIELVLREEEQLGRVVRNGSGSYELVRSAFAADVLAVLERL